MTRRLPFDTVAARLALTVVLAVLAAFGLKLVFVDTAGVWARPGLSEAGLFEQAAAMVRMMSVTPDPLRPRLAAAAGSAAFTVAWSRRAPAASDRSGFPEGTRIMRLLLDDPERRVVLFKAAAVEPSATRDPLFGTADFGMAVSLDDGSWLVFHVPRRTWGLTPQDRAILTLGFVLLATAAVSLLAARSLVRPIEAFATAALRFGADPKAPPMTERGPRELRAATAAFNAMQTQIQRFVTDRTDMLAAISHDLRTPLTRVRLRAEFIEDADQQRRLFRDVAEMQAMIDAALALFRDEVTEEISTDFELSELVRLIVDDLADQGRTACFEGEDHVVYHGRPFALKRAFGNIVENACMHAGGATVSVGSGPEGIALSVCDEGQGIPDNLLETVFSPFYRVERSRNRQTGGAGLGLTSARMIVRAHGGDVMLRNRGTGGLLVMVRLPPAGRSFAGAARMTT